ncbi:hypothetical protein [Bartonella taylorii]|uniref:hypothetical protein n=1 Tax=Bartonella taylorii TaxID=33046 RepID=UPI0002EFD747|nr:hypothetical protein [Bartonella taylorii]
MACASNKADLQITVYIFYLPFKIVALIRTVKDFYTGCSCFYGADKVFYFASPLEGKN